MNPSKDIDPKKPMLPTYVWLWHNEQGELQVALKIPAAPIVSECYMNNREVNRAAVEEQREAYRDARAAADEAYWQGMQQHGDY